MPDFIHRFRYIRSQVRPLPTLRERPEPSQPRQSDNEDIYSPIGDYHNSEEKSLSLLPASVVAELYEDDDDSGTSDSDSEPEEISPITTPRSPPTIPRTSSRDVEPPPAAHPVRVKSTLTPQAALFVALARFWNGQRASLPTPDIRTAKIFVFGTTNNVSHCVEITLVFCIR